MFPLLLLLILGFNGAIYLVLGELLVANGYYGFSAAVLHAFGSAVSLTLACYLTGVRPAWRRDCLSYYAICAFLGLIGPAISTLWVIPHIGTGLMAAVIATSPLLTQLISHLFHIEKFNLLLFSGIMLGFGGAAAIILGEATWPTEEGKYLWLGVSMIVPLFLASGNVARSALWPEGLTPMQAGSGISWVALLFAVILVPIFEPRTLVVVPPVHTVWIILAFVVLNGISALPYFLLQKIGGPTYLSLLSHVMAGFGLLLGALIFDESYRLVDFLGVFLILIGVSTTSYFKRHRKRDRHQTLDCSKADAASR